MMTTTRAVASNFRYRFVSRESDASNGWNGGCMKHDLRTVNRRPHNTTLGSGGCRPGQKVTCCCQLVRKSPWMTAPSPKGRPAHRRGAEQKGQPGMTALRCARSASAAARLRSQQPAAHRHGRGWPPLLSRKRRWPQRSAQQSTARTFHVKEHGCQTSWLVR